MADVAVPSIATATPAPGDTMLGVQGGSLKRFPVSAFPLAAELSDVTDSTKGAALVGFDNATVAERMHRALKVENMHGLRDFYKALDGFNQSEDTNITVGSYGDSVSADVAMMFADMLARQVGFMNKTSFTPAELSNAVVTPTGAEPAARWPGSTPNAALAGGATYVLRADGDTPDPVYSPQSDQHWVIPVGGSVTWGSAVIGGDCYRRVLAFLVQEPGAGTCRADLLDNTGAVVASEDFDLSHTSIACTKFGQAALDTSKGYRIRVTGLTGTCRALGVAYLYRRGVTMVAWRWGGSTFIQQSKSSKAIFDYVNSVLNTSVVFVETKGETSLDGIVGADDGIALTVTRLNALSASKVFIGSRPDSGTEASQYDQIYRYRDYAVLNGYVFIDGYDILKSYAELQRLVWDRRNNVVETTHLPMITAAYVASHLFNLIPLEGITNLWITKKVFSPKVLASGFWTINPTYQTDETRALQWALPHALNTGYTKLQNITSLKLINSVSAAVGEMSMLGGEISADKNIRAPEFVFTGGTLTTSAGAGAASALPAAPEKYMRLTVNGLNYKVALYPNT